MKLIPSGRGGAKGNPGQTGPRGFPGYAGNLRIGAGVPAGAPTGTELPFAYDTTLVSGGFYIWNTAAWVKVANIL